MVAGSQLAIPLLLIYAGAFIYFIVRDNGDGR